MYKRSIIINVITLTFGGGELIRDIYMIRHGETLFNVQGRTQGWSDSPLTLNGINQAKQSKIFFENFPVKFDAYFSSTSERACDTLELIFPNTSYRQLKGLKEQNFGVYEGQLQYLEPVISKRREFFVPFGGESWETLSNRLKETLLTICQYNEAYKTLLCVSHGAAISTLMKSVSTASQIEQLHGIGNLDMLHFTLDMENRELKAIEKISTI